MSFQSTHCLIWTISFCFLLSVVTGCKPATINDDVPLLVSEFEKYKITKLSDNNKHKWYKSHDYKMEYGSSCKIFMIVTEYKGNSEGVLRVSFRVKNSPYASQKYSLEDNCEALNYLPDTETLAIVEKAMEYVGVHFRDDLKMLSITFPLALLDSPRLDVFSVIKQRALEQPELLIRHKESENYPVREDMDSKLMENNLVKQIYDLMKHDSLVTGTQHVTPIIAFDLEIRNYGDVLTKITDGVPIETLLRDSYSFLDISLDAYPRSSQ